MDVAEVPHWNKGSMAVFRKPGAKAQALWNLQNKSPVIAGKIKEATGGRRLKTPVATRWNSYFDAMKCLMELVLEKNEVRIAMNNILSTQGVGLFDGRDINVIKEYLLVMTPVANCLDKIQCDKTAYMGNLLPDLMLLKQRLQKVKNQNLKYARSLVEYLLEQNDFHHGFNNR